MNIICFTTIFALILINESVQQECNDNGMRKFDNTMAKLLTIGNSGRKFPTDKGESLKQWCTESESYLKEMEAYKLKCLKDLSKQVFGVLIYGVKNAIKQYCRKDSVKTTELLQAVPCITKNDAIVTKCYTDMIDGILGAKNAPDNKKIPYLCCDYARIYTCFEEKLTSADKCNAKNVESVSDLVRFLTGNIVDLICGDYTEGSDKCENLGPTPKKKKDQRRTKSFAPPVFDLLSSFPPV